MVSMISQFLKGILVFAQGLNWLKRHPVHLLLLFIPIALSGALTFFGWSAFWKYSDHFFAWALFTKPDGILMLGLYYIAMGLLYLAVVAVGLMFFILIVSVLNSPIFDYVSVVVERDITGRSEEISLIESLKLMGEEVKKAIFILICTTLILLIPGVNVLTPFVTAFFLGWDMYDFPLARRGWSFSKRWAFVRSHFSAVLGLGVWLLVPGLQLILMPLAVPGATMLAIEHLNHESLS